MILPAPYHTWFVNNKCFQPEKFQCGRILLRQMSSNKRLKLWYWNYSGEPTGSTYRYLNKIMYCAAGS